MTSAVAFLESLLAGPAAGAGGAQGWLGELRRAALERAHALTLPTTREEDWRFTDLSSLYQLAFRPAAAAPSLAPAVIRAQLAPEAGALLVFVDGRYSKALSRPAPEGEVLVMDLGSAIVAHAGPVRERLGRVADAAHDAFGAINAAHLAEGAVVLARGGAGLAAPIQLLFVATQAEVAVHPRVLVVAEPGAAIELLECYESLVDGVYCANAVTEIAVGSGARVRHVRVQRESEAAYHLATCAVRLERDASYSAVSVALGARLSRLNLNVTQAGPGASIDLAGLALIGGRQLADTHSFIDHAAPHGTSRQLHKCIAAGQSHAVFNGRILVRPGAQLTNSAQESRNLLLSRRAHVDAKPQLEIFADDVKCAHGATVGQLESEELFYLRSRGLAEAAARRLLTYGFAAEVVERIGVASVAAGLREAVLAQTATGEAQ